MLLQDGGIYRYISHAQIDNYHSSKVLGPSIEGYQKIDLN